MTGFGDERLAVEIMKSGAVDYIVKSATTFEDLPAIAKRALRFWENHQERVRAEKAVQDSQKHLADILSFLPDPVLAIDNNGTVIAWNNAMVDLTGVPAAAMLGKGEYEYSLPFYGVRRPILIDLVLKDEPAIVKNYQYIHRDRQKIVAEMIAPALSGSQDTHLWATASPLFDAAGNQAGAIEVIRDITERKNTEMALQESERKYRFLVDNVRDAIWQTSPDLTFTYLSPAAEALTGYPVSELIGKSLLDLLMERSATDIRSRLRQHMDQYAKGILDLSASFDIEIRHKSGKILWLEVSSNPVFAPDRTLTGFQGISRDITSRKQAEEALEKSRIQLGEAMDLAQLVNWEFDVPTGIFTFNDRFYALYGTTAEREGGYQMPAEVYAREFVPPDERHLIADEVNASLQTTDPQFISQAEHRIIRRDGEVRTIVVRFGIIKDANGVTIKTHGANQDITERRRVEEALRESEIRFRALVQNSSDVVRILDRNGRIIYESPSASRILGYPPGFMTGRDPLDYIHPEDLKRVKADLSTVFENQNPGTPTEFRIRKADGTYIWVDSIATNLLDVPGVNGLVITTRPIQQRKESEQALHRSEERLRLALEGADAGFWDWHLPDGQAAFSDRFYTMLGYEPGEFPATFDEWSALMHPDDRTRIVPDLLRRIQNGDSQFEIEYRIRAKEGHWLWILGRGKIVEWDEAAKPLRMTGVNIDITSRRMMESEIRSLNTVLEQRVKDRTEALSQANAALEEENAQRLSAEAKIRSALEEKTMLLKEIHHRVKNNLQIIVSLLNLQSRYIKDEATLAAIRESQYRVKAMALVHEKLYKADDISHIDLNEYIRFLGTGLFQFYGASSRGIRFRLEIHEVSVDINSAIPLGLIVNELISNSLKYAFPEGRGGEISISVQKEGGTMTILFRDDGIGIPATLDWQNTQSLGLRLVNTLVDQLNGTIELDRSAGTQFTIIAHEKV
jgi:PAS domain S-box-containing protein